MKRAGNLFIFLLIFFCGNLLSMESCSLEKKAEEQVFMNWKMGGNIIPEDVVKYVIFIFFDQEIIKNVYLVNSDAKKAIDDFLIKKRIFKKYVFSYKIDFGLARELVLQIKRKLFFEEYSICPFMPIDNIDIWNIDIWNIDIGNIKGVGKNIIFLRKDNFGKELGEFFEKKLERLNSTVACKKKHLFKAARIGLCVALLAVLSYSEFKIPKEFIGYLAVFFFGSAGLMLTECLFDPIIDSFGKKTIESENCRCEKEKNRLKIIISNPEKYREKFEEFDQEVVEDSCELVKVLE